MYDASASLLLGLLVASSPLCFVRWWWAYVSDVPPLFQPLPSPPPGSYTAHLAACAFRLCPLKCWSVPSVLCRLCPL